MLGFAGSGRCAAKPSVATLGRRCNCCTSRALDCVDMESVVVVVVDWHAAFSDICTTSVNVVGHSVLSENEF